MTSTQQLPSTGPREDACALCLDKCTSKTAATIKYTWFHNIFQCMGCDIQKIFKVGRELPSGGEVDVDMDVLVCKRCRGRMEVFHGIHTKYKAIQQQLDASVKGIHGLMTNAKTNYVGNPPEHIVVMVEGTRGTSVPEKFWRKPIANKGSRKLSMTKGDTRMEEERSKRRNVTRLDSEDMECDAEFQGVEQVAGPHEIENVNMEQTVFSSGSIHLSENEDAPVDNMNCDSMANNTTGTSDGCEKDDLLSGISDDPLELDDAYDITSKGLIPADPSSSFTHPSSNKHTGANKKQRSKEYECDICGKVVATLKNFESHVWIHTGEKPFECQYCKQTFRDVSGLRRHFLYEHRHLMFSRFRQPGISEEQFQTGLDAIVQTVLREFTLSNRNSRGIGCGLCNQHYSIRIAVQEHVVQRHYDVLTMGIKKFQEHITTGVALERDDFLAFLKQIMAQENTARMCGTCGMGCKTGAALNVHVKTHIQASRGKPRFTPSHHNLIKLRIRCCCGKYFNDLEELSRHKKTLLNDGGCSVVPKNRFKLQSLQQYNTV